MRISQSSASAAESSAAFNANAFCSCSHCSRDSAFHRASERNSTFQLLRDLIADKLRVCFRTLHFVDKNFYFLTAGDILQFFFELRDLLAALPDNYARARSMDSKHDSFGRAVERKLREARALQAVFYIRTNEVILFGLLREILIVVPTRVPRARYCESESDRVCLLSQMLTSFVN